MYKVLLDTDIFSKILEGENRKIARRALPYYAEIGSYTISLVTVTELFKGFQKNPKQTADIEKRLLSWKSELEIMPLTFESAVLAGRIYGDLERTHQPIGRCDPMIAAIAIVNNLPLVTGNTEHYQRIIDLGYPLTIENWKD